MKFTVDNKTDLKFGIISKQISKYVNNENYLNDDIYIDVFKHSNKEYKMIIKMCKTMIKFEIKELKIGTNKISKKGLRFPKIKIERW